MPDFAKPEDVELPEWSTSFDPNSAGEKRAKAKVCDPLL
jgi:hypothetical protein